jgi:hypothetical protein
MIGISINSAFLSPNRGTAHRIRIGPRIKPVPKTIAKYIVEPRRIRWKVLSPASPGIGFVMILFGRVNK